MSYQLTRSELTLIQIQLQEIVTHGKPISLRTCWGLCWITKEALGLMTRQSDLPPGEERNKALIERSEKIFAVDELITHGIHTWPDAVSEKYPVPAPAEWDMSAQQAFEHAAISADGNLMWAGEYGARRLALAAHLLQYVTLKLEG